MKTKILLVIVFLIIMNIDVIGQNTIDDYYTDFSVPDISALSMLGIENDEIVRPGNLKEFAVGLSNFVNTDGTIKPAYAIEWSFLKTLSKSKNVEWNTRFWAKNLALTAGTTEQDSAGTKLAIGFKWVPIDKSDPIGDSDFYKRLTTKINIYDDEVIKLDMIFKSIDDIIKVLDIKEESEKRERSLEVSKYISNISAKKQEYIDMLKEKSISFLQKEIENKVFSVFKENEINKKQKDEIENLILEYVMILKTKSNTDYKSEIKDIIKNLKEEYKKEHWNALAFQISSGWLANSSDNKFSTISTDKISSSTSFAFPTINNVSSNFKGQCIWQVKYENSFNETSELKQNVSIGTRHLYGNSDNRWSVELLYSDSKYNAVEGNDPFNISYFRYTTGFEYKLTDGTWIEFAFGGQKFFEGEKESGIISTFGFKHALQSKRRFDNK